MLQFDRMPPISLLKGANLRDVAARDYDWEFVFDCGVSVVAEGHWRLLDPEAVVVTDEDHGQSFGLKESVDAASFVRNSVSDATVTAVAFRSPANDLLLSFSNGWTLEVLIGSGGYENWHVRGPGGSHTFAAGGGGLNHSSG